MRINVYDFAFNITLEFHKPVFDYRSKIPFAAETWDAGFIGNHGGVASYILAVLSELLDKFLVEFLRVNESACNDPQ